MLNIDLNAPGLPEPRRPVVVMLQRVAVLGVYYDPDVHAQVKCGREHLARHRAVCSEGVPWVPYVEAFSDNGVCTFYAAHPAVQRAARTNGLSMLGATPAELQILEALGEAIVIRDLSVDPYDMDSLNAYVERTLAARKHDLAYNARVAINRAVFKIKTWRIKC